jgi:hypothetical protein
VFHERPCGCYQTQSPSAIVLPEGAFIGIRSPCEDLEGLVRQLVMLLLTGVSLADPINGQVMGQAEQEGPLVARPLQEFGALGQAHEDLLEQVRVSAS